MLGFKLKMMIPGLISIAVYPVEDLKEVEIPMLIESVI
jgi:hypothetical protein